MIAVPLRYSLLCALVLGGLAVLAAQGARLGLAPALLLLPLAAWPAWLALAYPATVRRVDARSSLREGESPWWAPLLGGALWKQVAAVPVALLAAWSLAWSLIAQDWTAWLLAALAAGLSWPVAALVAGRTAALRPYARPRPVLLLAPRLVALVVTGAWVLALGLAVPAEGSLAERVAAEPRYEGASTLLAWAVDWTATLNGAVAWGQAWAERQAPGPWVAAWRLLGVLGQSWLLALVFAGLLLPRGAAGRILRPSEADEPPPVGAGRAGLAAFAATILLMVAVSLSAHLEGWAGGRQHPQAWVGAPGLGSPEEGADDPVLAAGHDPRPGLRLAGLPTPTDLRQAVEAERIGELTCPEGTIAGVDRLDAEMRAILLQQRDELGAAIGRAFDAMRANVPGYLDWYYSLSAEYARTGHLLLGDAEGYLEERLSAHLGEGEALAPVAAAIEDLAGNPVLLDGWREQRKALLGACAEIPLPLDGLAVAYAAEAPAGLLLSGPAVERLDLSLRLEGAGLGAVAGGIAGALLAKTLGKLAAKEAFGLAVEALAKVAAGKAVGGLGGAMTGGLAGAAGGSLVPVFGTTAGAVAGAVLGALALGVATDYSLIEVEEMVSRQAFEDEILLAIDEAEAELLGQLLPSQ